MLLLAVGATVGCAGIEVSEAPRVDRAEARYLVDPLRGYAPPLTPESARRIEAAHGTLLAGDLGGARQAAQALLAEHHELAPAHLLLAEVDLAAGAVEAAYSRARPLLELRGYTAAAVVAGRAAERLQRIPDAYEAYRSAASELPLAAAKANELRPRAVQILQNRIGDDLDRGRLVDAERELQRLRQWDPESEATLELVRRWATTADRPQQELEALRGLTALRPGDADLARRRAELEIEVGDVAEAMQLLQSLQAEPGADPEIDALLARARFHWRFELLPDRVQSLASEPILGRGGFAALVYWLDPRVRTATLGPARIAADVLDHPLRQEMVRVINLELIDIDSNRHAFMPDQPIERSTALQALLRLLARQVPAPACLAGEQFRAAASEEAICAGAVRCSLVPEVAACLPGATLTGKQAVDMIGRAVAVGGA